MAKFPPDPASFECAQRMKGDMASATRRMAGAVCTRSSSLSAIQVAAGKLLSVARGDGQDSQDNHNGAERGRGGRDVAATEEAKAEVVSIVFQVAQVCNRVHTHFGSPC